MVHCVYKSTIDIDSELVNRHIEKRYKKLAYCSISSSVVFS